MIDPPGPSRTYLIAMVGLPARGKTYTARKLQGYLAWLGYPTRSFNVGERRRASLGARHDAAFFDPANADAVRERDALFERVLDDALDWLAGGGRIAVLDATNSTVARRDRIRRACEARGVKLLFVELHDDDRRAVESNIRAGKITTADYEGVDPRAALADFQARIAHYASVYQPLGDAEGSWIRIADRGRNVTVHDATGWIMGRITSLLTNLAVGERTVWLTRHGQSEFNVEGRLGGDSPLTPAGHQFARSLASHVRARLPRRTTLRVWTSTARRTAETAAPLAVEPSRWRSLDEIQAGVCDGLTYAEVKRRWPREFAARGGDKLRYRYPGGESYEDVIRRADRVILELESVAEPVLVIAHRAVVRAMYAYFVQLPLADAPHVPVPLHETIELTPGAYGCEVRRVALAPQVAEPH